MARGPHFEERSFRPSDCGRWGSNPEPSNWEWNSLVLTPLLPLQSLQQRVAVLQTDLEEGLRASKNLIGDLDPMTTDLVQSECRLLARGVLRLSQSLVRKLTELQVGFG